MDKKKVKKIFNAMCIIAGIIFIISVITRQFIINIVGFILILIADRMHQKYFHCPNCGKPLGSIKRRACPYCDYSLVGYDETSDFVVEATEVVEVDEEAEPVAAEEESNEN